LANARRVFLQLEELVREAARVEQRGHGHGAPLAAAAPQEVLAVELQIHAQQPKGL
jgi:hypothetical protein